MLFSVDYILLLLQAEAVLVERRETRVEFVDEAQFSVEADDEQIFNSFNLRENVLHFLLVDVVVFEQNLEEF